MSIWKTLAVVSLLAALAACTSAPIQNLSGMPISDQPDGTAPSEAQVRKAIMKGCVGKGWTPEFVEQGLIRCSIVVRSHQAEVDIPYTRESYDIVYRSSVNLDHEGDEIHRNYNKWVVNLSESIRLALLENTY